MCWRRARTSSRLPPPGATGAARLEHSGVDEAAVREASDRLPQLQADLEELRSRRQLMTPAQ